jgi:hypothetical protein
MAEGPQRPKATTLAARSDFHSFMIALAAADAWRYPCGSAIIPRASEVSQSSSGARFNGFFMGLYNITRRYFAKQLFDRSE